MILVLPGDPTRLKYAGRTYRIDSLQINRRQARNTAGTLTEVVTVTVTAHESEDPLPDDRQEMMF